MHSKVEKSDRASCETRAAINGQTLDLARAADPTTRAVVCFFISDREDGDVAVNLTCAGRMTMQEAMGHVFESTLAFADAMVADPSVLETRRHTKEGERE